MRKVRFFDKSSIAYFGGKNTAKKRLIIGQILPNNHPILRSPPQLIARCNMEHVYEFLHVRHRPVHAERRRRMRVDLHL